MRRPLAKALLLTVLLAGCADGDGPDGDTDRDSDADTAIDCSDPPVTGAPVPLRRLTAVQLENTVNDVLGMQVAYPIADEALIGYRANTQATVDTPTARGIQRAAETTAAFLAPRGAGLAECTDEGCADFVLDVIAPRLFRRPVPEAERAPYRDVYAAGFEVGGRAEGLRWLLEAMLQSPRFLHQLEHSTEDGRLDGYSLAARLSYALWAGPPDDALLAAAAEGQLADDEGVELAVAYMIADARFERGMQQWVQQWMHLEELHEASERPDLLELAPDTVVALEQEPVAFVTRHVREGGTVFDLLSAAESPSYPALAEVYGADLTGVDAGSGLAQLDPQARAGLVTLPGVQAALSHARDTSPSRRGAAVMGQLLCANPGAPPDDVSPNLPPPQEGQSKRERLEQHFSDPTCAQCHETMDGFGFAFEGYDWFGRSRTMDHGHPVDTQVSIPWGPETIEADGAVDLSLALAERRDVAVCVAKQWSRYATSVREKYDEPCLFEDMADAAQGPDGLRGMLVAHALSDWFRRPADPGGR